MVGWTNEAQREVALCTFTHLDFSAGNYFATNKAVPFLIQEVPLPKLIEPS
jgi:hypothetical protein